MTQKLFKHNEHTFLAYTVKIGERIFLVVSIDSILPRSEPQNKTIYSKFYIKSILGKNKIFGENRHSHQGPFRSLTLSKCLKVNLVMQIEIQKMSETWPID